MIDLSGYSGANPDGGRLCVNNMITGAVLTASGGTASALRGPQTYSAWTPPALPGWVLATPTAPEQVGYIAAYIPEGGGCTFAAQTDLGAGFNNLGTPMVVDAGTAACLLWIIDQQALPNVRLYVSGGTADPYVSVFKAGVALEVPRCPDSGWAPSWLNPVDRYTNERSKGGQVLGSRLERAEAEEALMFSNLPSDWVRANWPTLRDQLRREGVVFAWSPQSYPDELVYGMTDGEPNVGYTAPRRMSLSLKLQGPRI